jgi:hypothetical protein
MTDPSHCENGSSLYLPDTKDEEGDDKSNQVDEDDDCEDDDEDGDGYGDEDDRILPEHGLSAEALRALLEFQMMGGLAGADGGFGSEAAAVASTLASGPSEQAVCVAYTAKDSLVIAQTLKRLQQKAEEDNTRLEDGARIPDPAEIPVLLEEKRRPGPSSSSSSLTLCSVQELADAFERDGAIRIDRVLSDGTCDACLEYVNQALDRQHDKAASEQDDGESDRDTSTITSNNDIHCCQYGFGNVFSRQHRYDMYLRPEHLPCAQALEELLDRQYSRLGQLIQELVERNSRDGKYTGPGGEGDGGKDPRDDRNCGADWYFHEFSALVADPGCHNQPLHPDAPYTNDVMPLFTVFVALQNVEEDMGPTIVVPGTHKIRTIQEAVERSGGSSSSPPSLSAEGGMSLRDPASYRRALLCKGDCLVMDARTYHLGSANTSSSIGRRRALLYFTLRNPRHGLNDSDFPPNGSLFDDLRGKMKLSDYNGSGCSNKSSSLTVALLSSVESEAAS